VAGHQGFSAQRRPVALPATAGVHTDEPYCIVLFNDDEHSFAFVVQVLAEVFGYPLNDATLLTQAAHDAGQTIVFVGDRQDAERKCEKMLAYGADSTVPSSKGPLQVAVRPAVCP